MICRLGMCLCMCIIIGRWDLGLEQLMLIIKARKV